jgi:hypothetical protein
MKKYIAMLVVFAAVVAGVHADVVENMQIGGRSSTRDTAWNKATGSGSSASYTFAAETDTDLEITISLTSNYSFDWDGTNPNELDNSTHVAVDSGAGDTHTSRLTDDETITLTVSYVDPNGNLSGLSVKEFGAYWGNGSTVSNLETTVFTDAIGNSTTLTSFNHGDPETLIDYSTTGLKALTKDNTGTWSMTVSVGPTLAGSTTSGLGGFELEYSVIPEPATMSLVGLTGVVLIAVRRRFTHM